MECLSDLNGLEILGILFLVLLVCGVLGGKGSGMTQLTGNPIVPPKDLLDIRKKRREK